MECLNPKITVIIPVYGVEKYIERCVRSLMEQTIDNLEFIFVDDCTPDASIEIAKKIVRQYPERSNEVKWLSHKINKGITAARNTGLSIAKGEYIYYCDSDDFLSPKMLSLLYSEAKKHDYDLVWSDFYFDYGDKKFIVNTADVKVFKVDMLKEYIKTGWTVVWNIICKREIYVKNDLRSDEKISFCEDYELTVKLFACSKSWGKISKPLYFYNKENPCSIISTSLSAEKRKKTILDEIRACNSIWNFMDHRGLKDVLLKELSWRNLKAKRGLLFPVLEEELYKNLWPESDSYVDSNPFCSKIDKLYQHLMLRNYGPYVIKFFNYIRRFI